MEHYYLDFEPMGKIFYVADSVIKRFEDEGKIPILELSAHDHMKIGCVSPDFDAPIIGFLASRSGNCYSISVSNVQALAGKGFRIRLLTYEHCAQQLEDCSGVVLDRALCAFPKNYYIDPWHHDEPSEMLDVQVVALCLQEAIKLQLPVLAIGDCALVVAGEFGMKLCPDTGYIETPIKHMTNKAEAHRLNVFPNTPLSRLLQKQDQFFVNSRHTAILAPKKMQYEVFAERFHIDIDRVELPLDIYAEANDGVPEAWGAEKLHIMCVQCYPEDVPLMANIYQGLAEDIAILR